MLIKCVAKIAFSHRPLTRHALAWWSACVYNWVRPHRNLRQPLEQPQGKGLCLNNLDKPFLPSLLCVES